MGCSSAHPSSCRRTGAGRSGCWCILKTQSGGSGAALGSAHISSPSRERADGLTWTRLERCTETCALIPSLGNRTQRKWKYRANPVSQDHCQGCPWHLGCCVPSPPAPYLGFLHGEVAGADHAEPCLPLQAALGVVVGHSGRDAHPAALGARAPLCGLHHAVLLQVVQLRLVSWILPEN